MSFVPKSIIVTSGSPDALNTNAILRTYAADGFRSAFQDTSIAEVAPERALGAVRAAPPDLLVIFGSVMVNSFDHSPIVEAVRRRGGKVAFWLHDDPYEFDASFRILHLADAIFTNELACLDFYPKSSRVYHLPMAASPHSHFRLVEERKGPTLFFAGHMYLNRIKFLQRVRRLEPDLLKSAMFLGTSDHAVDDPAWTTMRIPNATLADFNAVSFSVLNIGRDLDIANSRFGVRASTPGPRTFEAAMSGAAQIIYTEGCEIHKYFRDGEECLVAADVETFIEHLHRIIHVPRLSETIGLAAQKRALQDHTYAARATKLISDMYG